MIEEVEQEVEGKLFMLLSLICETF